MRLKLEHQSGCGCAACQGKYQQPVDNIDGYASGFELAPDPNQEISPELMDNPGFIQNIINQILQQMGGGEMEEQLDPMISKDFAPDVATQAILNPMMVPGPGGKKPIFKDPCLGIAQQHTKDDKFILNPGGGGGVGPQSLSEESSKVEEGSCGYSQSATGESLKTPGGIKGVEAQSRTNRMKKGGLDEHDPKAPQNHKVQTNTASEDKSYFKY